MKAARVFGPRDVRYVDIDRPLIGPNDVLIKVKAVGICGTDLEIFRGTMPFFSMGLAKFPITPGHEWSGIVEDVGEEVKKLKTGQRVTGDVSIGCGKCSYCLRGRYNLCLDKQEVGICRGKEGAYADYLSMPQQYTYPLPNEISYEEGALLDPTATAANAIIMGQVTPGDTVLVQGDGPIGLLCLQAARAAGAACCILSGTYENKLKLAKSLGAKRVVNVHTENLVECVNDLTSGLKADVVIEASGNPKAIKESVKLVKPSGVISVVGIYEKRIPEFDVSSLVLNEVKLFGVLAYPGVMPRAMRLIAEGIINVKPLITHRLHLSEVKEGFRIMEKEIANRMKVLLFPE